MTDLIEPALTWHTAAFCTLPAAGYVNGTLRPGATDPKQPWPDGPQWKRYQSERPTVEQLRAWFTGKYSGLGVACGAVSGNLEMLEFEGRAITEGFLAEAAGLADAAGLTQLWQRVMTGYLELTPGGGIHTYYRIDGAPVPGNVKLAERPAFDPEVNDDERKVIAERAAKGVTWWPQRTLIETRGEGGFAIVAPSNGTVHPAGKPWKLITGGVATIPVITAVEHKELHRLLRSLDQMPAAAPRPFTQPGRAQRDPADGKLAGEDYNERTDWADILEPRGWALVATSRDGTRSWCRPGKSLGVSATTGHPPYDNLFVFSTSTEFEAWTPSGKANYTKFGAYALLGHGGDYKAAAADLSKQGYGSQPYGGKSATSATSAASAGQRVADSKPVADASATWDGDLGELLDRVHKFLGRFVAYPSKHAQVAHTLWITHTHKMDAWESTPRIAFLSPEPGSGKTRALEVSELLVPRPVEAVNTTPAYLFRKVSDAAGPPTILYDEIDTLFGPKAKDNEEIRGMLNAGHRRGAQAGRCVVRGKIVETEELPAYCAVAIAGLGNLPDTLMTRSVVVRMKRRAPGEKIEPFRRRLHLKDGHAIRDELALWATSAAAKSIGDQWPEMPDGIADRDADVWECLLMIADAAGGEWPARARAAAVALVADSKADSGGSLGIRLLGDIRSVWDGTEGMHTETLLGLLNRLDEAPWGELKGKPLDPRRLSRFLGEYGAKPCDVRADVLEDGQKVEKVRKGYKRSDLHDAWQRYLPPDKRPGCTVCGKPLSKEFVAAGWTDHGNCVAS